MVVVSLLLVVTGFRDIPQGLLVRIADLRPTAGCTVYQNCPPKHTPFPSLHKHDTECSDTWCDLLMDNIAEKSYFAVLFYL